MDGMLLWRQIYDGNGRGGTRPLLWNPPASVTLTQDSVRRWGSQWPGNSRRRPIATSSTLRTYSQRHWTSNRVDMGMCRGPLSMTNLETADTCTQGIGLQWMEKFAWGLIISHGGLTARCGMQSCPCWRPKKTEIWSILSSASSYEPFHAKIRLPHSRPNLL